MRNALLARASMGATILLLAALATACGKNNEDNNGNNNPGTEDMTSADMNMNTPDEGMDDTDMGMDEPDEGTPDMTDEPDEGTPDMGDDTDMTVEPPTVDVPEVEPNDEVDFEAGTDQATPFMAGQSFGGNFSPSGAGEYGDVDIYKVDLKGGSLFEWSISNVGDGITDAGVAVVITDATTGAITRALYSADGEKRQAFIPEDDTYYIYVYDAIDEADPETILAHGGPTATYAVETSEVMISAVAGTIPGTINGDLNDGDVDVHSFTWMTDLVISAQVIAGRAPVESDLDSILYLWDADAGELVSSNDDLNDETFDSGLAAQGVSGTNYFLIVDSYVQTANSDYVLDVTGADDAPDAPGALVLGTPSMGVIGDADMAAETYDTDFWAITAQPGETIRFAAVGAPDMQPTLTVYLNDQGFFDELAYARPVGDTAAATISIPSTLDAAVELYVLIDDLRNLPTDEMDAPDYVGGDTFTYTLDATAATHGITDVTLPVAQASSLAAAGAFDFYKFSSTMGSFVLIDAVSSYSDATDTAEMIVARYEPTENAISFLAPSTTYINSTGGDKVFGVVDAFYQAGTMATPYDYLLTIKEVDVSTQTPTQMTEPSGNVNVPAAVALTPPVQVADQTQAMDPATPQYDYYKVDLTAGQTLIALTGEDPNAPAEDPNDPMSEPVFADTIMRILDGSGMEIASNDDLVGDESSTFSALHYTADTDGTYYIVIEPYYSDFFGEFDNGHYLLSVYVAD